MHYYQHHIGDFIKATSRLSDAQAMAYLRLLWMYYDSEKPLPNSPKVLAFQLGMVQEDVELLLQSFFCLEEDGWHQSRCDQEIADYRSFLEKKSNAGRASAERRKNSSSTGVEQVLNECSTDVQLTTNQQPVTTNHKPKVMRGTRLDHDCLLPSDWSNFCKEKRPDLVPREVFDSFKDYWIAQPGQKGVKLDWDATWRNWVRSQKVKPGSQLTVPSRQERDPALVKLDQDRKNREQIPAEVRQKLQSILRR